MYSPPFSYVESAHFLFWIAAIAALYAAVIPHKNQQRGVIAIGSAGAVLSFISMAAAFVTLDFSSALVASHSHSGASLLYRITGLWGNHEGSLLMWLLVLWIYAFWLSRTTLLPAPITQLGARLLMGIITAFNVYLLTLSSPFTRLTPPALDGNGLNPLLQDPALAAHPPMLYAGYVGFAAVYALTAAYCLMPHTLTLQDFAERLRPFVLIPWAFLTVGIGLGSFWAYYELGWGGFWFWDPVENASLLPWLLGTALLHSLIATAKRGAFPRWTLLLALSAFCASTLGLFLVRSGVITSVHAFAVDPARGVAILSILAGLLVFGLASFARFLESQPKAAPRPAFSLRTSALAANNYALTAVFVIVCLGTVYPLLLASIGAEPVSVGAPYYNAAVVPWLLGILVMMAAAPYTAWDSTPRLRLQRLCERTVAGALLFLLALIITQPQIDAASAALAFIALLPLSGAFVQAFSMPKGVRLWGVWLAHGGAGIAALAVVAAVSWRSERIVAMQPGERITLAGQELLLESVQPYATPAYVAQRARFVLLEGGIPQGTLNAEQRFYTHGDGTSTSEVGLLTHLTGDVYVALGERRMGETAWPVHATVHPLQPWLWAGALLMTAGGFSAATRRIQRMPPC